MSGRIEFFGSEKEQTSKWSKNSKVSLKEAGLDIGSDKGGGGGTDDYTALSNLPKINGTTLIGNKDSERDLHIEDSEPLTVNQMTNLLSLIV